MLYWDKQANKEKAVTLNKLDFPQLLQPRLTSEAESLTCLRTSAIWIDWTLAVPQQHYFKHQMIQQTSNPLTSLNNDLHSSLRWNDSMEKVLKLRLHFHSKSYIFFKVAFTETQITTTKKRRFFQAFLSNQLTLWKIEWTFQGFIMLAWSGN